MRLEPADFRADLSDDDIKALKSDLASASLIKLPNGCRWDFILRFAAGASPGLTAGDTLDFTPEQAALFGFPLRHHRLDVVSMSISFGEDSGTEYRLVEQSLPGNGV